MTGGILNLQRPGAPTPTHALCIVCMGAAGAVGGPLADASECCLCGGNRPCRMVHIDVVATTYNVYMERLSMAMQRAQQPTPDELRAQQQIQGVRR